MDYSLPPGVYDITPNDPKEVWRSTHLWEEVEEIIRSTCKDFGYEEVRTPTFEKTELFLRSSGEGSDIVSKELYQFDDKGGRNLSLRAEGTAPAIRSYVEWSQERQKVHPKIFYIEPMFRYDRPQAGRYRQHCQFGAEAIGFGEPEQDAEIIALLMTFYIRLQLKDISLEINSLGNKEGREKYLKALVDYYTPLRDCLSKDSQKRLLTNPLRILDSKDVEDKKINNNAPSILDFLNSEDKAHFEEVKMWLDKLGISYNVNPKLVRGLDYYNRTVFEITSGALGAQNSIGAGGRYDGLVKQIGGQDLPAIGFGTGLERIIQTRLAQNVGNPESEGVKVLIIPYGDKAKEPAFLLTQKLRQSGISSSMDFSYRKLNKVMQRAHQSKVKYVIVLGENEIAEKSVNIKEMATGKEIPIHLDDLVSYFRLEERIPQLNAWWNELYIMLNSPELKRHFLDKLGSEITQTKENLDTISTHLRGLKEVLNG